MKSKYWDSVGGRLKSLGKTVFDMTAPVAVDFAITKTVEKACSIIEMNLKKMYRRTAINSSISFVINFAGVMILIFKPFGIFISRIVTYIFFAASFIFWLVRTLIFVKKHGKTSVQVLKTIFSEKSVYNGIEKYVLKNFPVISLGYAGIFIAAEYVPSLREIPSISEFVSYLVKIFWKRLALFGAIMAVYTVCVFWIVKPALVSRYF